LYDNGSVEALQELSRKKPNEKNRVPEYVEQAVIELAIENPALGQYRAANELLQRGIIVSGNGIRSIWLRNDKVMARKARQERIKKAEYRPEFADFDINRPYTSYAVIGTLITLT
jgi:hypothetical protein